MMYDRVRLMGSEWEGKCRIHCWNIHVRVCFFINPTIAQVKYRIVGKVSFSEFLFRKKYIVIFLFTKFLFWYLEVVEYRNSYFFRGLFLNFFQDFIIFYSLIIDIELRQNRNWISRILHYLNKMSLSVKYNQIYLNIV